MVVFIFFCSFRIFVVKEDVMLILIWELMKASCWVGSEKWEKEVSSFFFFWVRCFKVVFWIFRLKKVLVEDVGG